MTNAIMWAGIVGFLSPVVIQFIAKSGMSRQVQAGIAFLFCLAVAIPTAYFAPNSDLDVHDYTKSALIIFTVAIASYKGFWNPVGVAPSNHSGTS
jgi:hypothetical protein